MSTGADSSTHPTSPLTSLIFAGLVLNVPDNIHLLLQRAWELSSPVPALLLEARGKEKSQGDINCMDSSFFKKPES